MKFLILFLTISCSFGAAATTMDGASKKEITTEFSIGGDKGKKARKNKRINKKRKRKCSQFAKRSFAG